MKQSILFVRISVIEKILEKFNSSDDLTPLDFFFWGYLKERVDANDPQKIDDFKENIIEAISIIRVISNCNENVHRRTFSNAINPVRFNYQKLFSIMEPEHFPFQLQ